MTAPEIEDVLSSMVVLRDSREQQTARAKRRYELIGLPVQKAVLDFGDYTYNATLPDGSMIYNTDRRVVPQCSIERKMNLDELAGCFTHDRERFKNELERCRDHSGRLYLLVENASWELINLGKYRSRMNHNAFMGTLTAWMARYDMHVIFCKEDTTPILIREILYRELKERLQSYE